jgi:hypothetical protein
LYYDQQKKQIYQYKELKRRTDDLLNMPGSFHQYHQPNEMMFYERQQNFGFPITTTTAEGGVYTSTLGSKKPNALEGLTKVAGENIKTGHVQLDGDHTFGGVKKRE